MSERSFALGLDYGTNSVRALIVDVATGEEVGTGVYDYRKGEHGVLLDPSDPNLARQDPQEYIEGLYGSIEEALSDASTKPGFDAKRVVGIGVDTTASTPLPVDENLQPLAFRPEFKNNLNAQAWLWKDHTSIAEAQEITEKAADMPYMAKCGGAYSSEWFWSKILHCHRIDAEVARAAYSWIECCDFVPAYLTGQTSPNNVMRGACAAGHKGMWNSTWGGLPSKEYLSRLDPRLADLRDRLYDRVYASDACAGSLAPEVAQRTGLNPDVAVSVGAIDAHLGAVGSGIRPGTLVKIIGTSSCDIMVAPADGSIPDIPGLSGIAEESVLPGALGLEGGQAAVGDLYNWGANLLASGDHEQLQKQAQTFAPGASGLLALDWNNGNRNILTDQALTGLILGQNLHTSAAEIYRALIEATAFGALRIVERIEEYGGTVDQVVCCGGIAEKSPLTMQIYADVLNRPIRLSRSGQTCALGAAICGAVAAGAHPSVEAAQAAMTGFKPNAYTPNPAAAKVYAEIYQLYLRVHNAFGVRGSQDDLSDIMKRLIAIRQNARRA